MEVASSGELSFTSGVSEGHAAEFADAGTVWELTGGLCVALVEETRATGCIVSRVIGDVLVQIAEHVPDGRTFQLGRGFLVSQFPTTAEVLATGVARAVSVADDAPDLAEVAVLDELSMRSVVMLALAGGEEAWGLVEVYRDSTSFTDGDIERAQRLVESAAAQLAALTGPPASEI
jgi:GAF domain-containing protein